MLSAGLETRGVMRCEGPIAHPNYVNNRGVFNAIIKQCAHCVTCDEGRSNRQSIARLSPSGTPPTRPCAHALLSRESKLCVGNFAPSLFTLSLSVRPAIHPAKTPTATLLAAVCALVDDKRYHGHSEATWSQPLRPRPPPGGRRRARAVTLQQGSSPPSQGHGVDCVRETPQFWHQPATRSCGASPRRQARRLWRVRSDS